MEKIMIRGVVTLLLFLLIVGVSLPSRVFAYNISQKDTSVSGSDDLQPQDTLASFKKRRDLSTQRLRAQVFQAAPFLKNNPSDLAKAVMAYKIRMVREREFLEKEFSKGLEALYQKAIDQYRQKQFAASQKNFKDIDALSANYRETCNYLKILDVVDDKSNPQTGLNTHEVPR